MGVSLGRPSGLQGRRAATGPKRLKRWAIVVLPRDNKSSMALPVPAQQCSTGWRAEYFGTVSLSTLRIGLFRLGFSSRSLAVPERAKFGIFRR